MKKCIALCLSLFLLAGCVPAGMKTNYVAPTKLSRETERALELTGWNGEFFDIKTDQKLKEAIFQCWSLSKDGVWEPVGERAALGAGRSEWTLAAYFGDDLSEGFRVIETDGDLSMVYDHNMEPEKPAGEPLTGNREDYDQAEKELLWTAGGPVVYGEAMPLVYQAEHIYQLDAFEGSIWADTDAFLAQDYFGYTREDWRLYCLTVTFETE